MAEFSYASMPEPDEQALIREIATMPVLADDLRARVLAAATSARRRRVFVARVQMAVASVLLFTTVTGLSGYYLSMWYGNSLIVRATPAPQERTISTGLALRQNLVAAWRSADDWDLVESRIQYKSYQTSVLQRTPPPKLRQLAATSLRLRIEN